MHASILALGTAALAGFSSAQTTSQQNYPYTIDPNTVSESDRTFWCDQNIAQCPLICLQQPGVTSMSTEENSCDSTALTYTCVCENGVVPNVTQYSQTLPFFICQEWGNNCVANCRGDNTCQSKCRSDHPCGAQSPFLGNASLSSTATAGPTGGASATNSIPITGFGGQQPTGSSSSGNTGAASTGFVPNAGLSLAAVFGSVFLGFAILL
ncbi:hypothetical protein IAQ61_004044 [Plenodomus lingam]|uniref:DUF7707 domain-containing protein n=1 Tax=Leptosphaeria maculans (strain JN3 / isolate v23.1.3 / race Av1-4-5-6-7-8) TaxID=985895 RepID=E4ZX10_LEPMJ|nr:hypothetical protein LEMA_P023720.1 [Plenodomus lingam JN3]KAH9873421.1 hypothetical protein IAQ61_004044 [Plenodomus lingam]CBX95220.1 hypothetical protein LEMA_P023720.1 [Plenodomus lingam JN3]